MKILINEKLSEHRFKDNNGNLICTNCVLARTGKQSYQRNEVFDTNDDSEIEIDRKAEEVFSPATLASFENAYVTIEHPDEDVNPNNSKEYAVGFVRNIREGLDNNEKVMLGDLVITDNNAIEIIESGEMNQLSCGYDCDIIDEENPQQRNIRGNHVALCQCGRAGNARIVDSVKDAGVHQEEMAQNKYDELKKERELIEKEIDRNDNNPRYDINSAINQLNKIDEEIKKLKKIFGYAIQDKLIESSSEEAFKKNIATEIRAGKDPKQAAAIAYSVQRENDSVKDSKIYGITTLKKYLAGNRNPELVFDDLNEAKYLKNSMERADRITYVIFKLNDGTKVDSLEETNKEVTKNLEKNFEEFKEQRMKDDYSNEELRRMKFNTYRGIDIYKIDNMYSLNPNYSEQRHISYNGVKQEIDRMLDREMSMDSIKDSLDQTEIEVVEDAIYWLKREGKEVTVSNVLKQINEDMKGFLGANQSKIINYLKTEKHIKDSQPDLIKLFKVAKNFVNKRR